ncbi:MAG: elongation factor G [Alphaproteobacteria bacterium 32-64-14]|nr:MAG: elongation factor G [Alphaproteobacteria bacterium 32-64-14]
MSGGKAATVRAVALSGPSGTGKTTLLESMLHVAGRIQRKGSVAQGTSVGDGSEEARARGLSTELNIAGFDYLGDRFVVMDCPGSVDFAAEADMVLPVADITIVVADPDPLRASLLQPILRRLDELQAPHCIFINKIDKARGRVRELVAAIQPYSLAPLVARQIPIWNGSGALGYIDLALERAYAYEPGKPSTMIQIPEAERAREIEARYRMLEQMADFDDRLMEDLINETEPPRDHVMSDLASEVSRMQIVPVFLGSAENGAGVRRLLKALRHETPPLGTAAARLGADGASAAVIRTRHVGQAGRQTVVRVMSGEISDGDQATLADGASERIAGIFSLHGESQAKQDKAGPGDVVCLGRLDKAARGDLISFDGASRQTGVSPPSRPPSYSLAIETQNRADDVKLAPAMARLVDEDGALVFAPDPVTREFRLGGQGEMHLRVALDRLKRKFGVSVASRRPQTAYRETIRKSSTQRGKHKKQSGGHGQFGDVLLDVRPGRRGTGLVFDQKIHGGVVPRQYFGAVEEGARDALASGPLGFPVVDVEVTLLDGSYHAVDSSEIAFRTAARIGVSAALQACDSVLLEPVHAVTIHTPTDQMARITAIIPMRRGQILGFEPRDGWFGWDSIRAYLPEDELHDLIIEVRSATQGLGEFVFAFDHMAEVTGKSAAKAIEQRQGVPAK